MAAKEAITSSITHKQRKQTEQLLPLEPAALEVGGSKQTRNPSGAIRGILERREAVKFYNEELGWPLVTLNCINWEGLSTKMENKGDPFRLWFLKQVNKFAALNQW